MNLRLHSVSRVSSAGSSFFLIACLTCFAPALGAQAAHFSGAVMIPGGTPSEPTRSAVAPELGVAAPQIQATHGEFGSVKVGVSSANPITLIFTFDADVTIGSTAVVTQGAPDLDFTDAGGGTCQVNTAYHTGDKCTVKVAFKPRLSGIRYGAAELLDASGGLLATGYVQGTGVGPQVMFANTSFGVYAPSKLRILHSGFAGPIGVAVDGSGNVIVADTWRGAVKELVAAGGYTTIKSLGGSFSSPVGPAVDGGGNIFLVDGNRLKEIQAAGGYQTVKPLVGGFDTPIGVAVDGSGNVFVADQEHNAVKEVLAAGGYTVVKVIGSGFNLPSWVAVDGNDNVFVTDQSSDPVKEIVAVGGYTTVRTLNTGLNPSGVAVDGNGNVFVANDDFGNSAVREFVAASGFAVVRTLGGGLTRSDGLAVDGSGNIFICDFGNRAVEELDFADPPSLTFAKTSVGSESNDSQTLTVTNNGNAVLTFPIPSEGQNPSIIGGSDAFTLDAETTCPEVSASSSAAGKLAKEMSCDYVVDFSPPSLGNFSASLTLTDDDLNANPLATHTIALNGAAIPPHLVFTGPPPASLLAGQGPGTVSVAVEDPGNNVMTTSSATVKLIVTGPNSYSKAYTVTASSGIATFSSLSALNSAGSFTYTARDFPDGLTQAVASETVTWPPPFGVLGKAADSVTLSTTVSQSHSLKVQGWVADLQDGAPMSDVKVYVDGVSIGTPTLGLQRPAVAATYGSAYLNSGYLMLYPASSLSLGAHQVRVIAIDSGGRSRTLGPRTITVQ